MDNGPAEWWAPALGTAVMIVTPRGAVAALQPPPAACQFVLGLADLRARIPAQVGQCLEGQQTNVAKGDAYQRTSGWMRVWRKADNWTAFTDGFRTWLNGPRGPQQRLNTERYSWEGDAGAPGTVLVADVPPPAAPDPVSVRAPVVTRDLNLSDFACAGRRPGGTPARCLGRERP
jgi:hypothetical protein